MPPCGRGTLCPLHLNAWGGGSDPSLLSGGSQQAPQDVSRPSAQLNEPQGAASTIPSPDAMRRGPPRLPQPQGCSWLPRSWLGNGVWLQGAKARGAGCEETLTLLKLDLQHVRGVGRGGRIAGLRVEPRGGLILPQGLGRAGREEGESVALAWPTLPAAPTPARIPHPRCAPPSQSVGPARHSTGAYRGPRNKGVGGISQFFPST